MHATGCHIWYIALVQQRIRHIVRYQVILLISGGIIVRQHFDLLLDLPFSMLQYLQIHHIVHYQVILLFGGEKVVRQHFNLLSD